MLRCSLNINYSTSLPVFPFPETLAKPAYIKRKYEDVAPRHENTGNHDVRVTRMRYKSVSDRKAYIGVLTDTTTLYKAAPADEKRIFSEKLV